MSSEGDIPTNEALDKGAEEAAEVETQADAQASDRLAEWKTRVAYLSAEIENMRKRFLREKSDVIRFANEGLIRILLPVLDNLQLALQSALTVETGSGLLKGLEMTLKHFEQTLEQIGVQPIQSVGQNFDPAVHEALSQITDASVKDNEVTSELQRGFMLHGRVIRPAKVVVNKVQN